MELREHRVPVLMGRNKLARDVGESPASQTSLVPIDPGWLWANRIQVATVEGWG